jgi:uncharacterized metal-binding protein YceD (DUF177 family)
LQLVFFIDRLQEQEAEEVVCQLPPTSMEVDEPTLAFREPVNIQGEAYLADNYVVFHGSATTQASIPCTVCNEWVAIPVKLEEFYHAEPVEQAVKGAIDFGPIIRDALLLEVPQFAECGGGQCPKRAELVPFLRAEKPAASPFKDL